MLELQDCDDILNIPKDEYCNHNMAMRKRMAAQAELSSIQSSESPKMHEADNKKELQVGNKNSCSYNKNATSTFQKTIQSTLVPADKDVIKPSVDVPTKCVTSKKIKIVTETDLAKVPMLEIEKDKGGTKETMQAPRRHGQSKRADILAEQNLVAQLNLCQKGNDVGKSVQVICWFFFILKMFDKSSWCFPSSLPSSVSIWFEPLDVGDLLGIVTSFESSS